MLRKILGFLIVFLILGLLSLVSVAWFYNLSPLNKPERVSFSIERGANLDTIAQNLEKQNLIKSAIFLRALAKIRGTDQSFQQGNYAFAQNLSTLQIHDLIVSGKQVNLRITVPEGFTISQIAKHLENQGICQASEFLAAATDKKLLKEMNIAGASAEGYLFPDTYFFPQDFPANAAVRFMISNFKLKIKELSQTLVNLTPVQLAEKVVLASIVEREYINPAEAPLMASVFYNRLAIKKPLESCATVVYVMTEQYRLPHPHRLFFRDLDRKSEYNTYLHQGLPPGPISNPGMTALKAAFFPAKSDFLYFVLKGPQATQHFFSRTFAEHNSASIFYLKG